MTIFRFLLTPEFWYAVLRGTTPVLYATLAANIVSQCGILNLAIEGTMLSAALTGVLVSAFAGAGLTGLLLGLACGLLIGLLFAWALGLFALKLKANMVISSIALNLTATGGTVFIMYTLIKDKGVTSSLLSSTFPTVGLPFIRNIPFAGAFLDRAFSGHNILTYFAILCVVLLWLLLYKTPLGLQIRAVGENRQAAESVGIRVGRVQFIALSISGVMAAMGGLYLSMGYLSFFNANMTSGRGYLALAMDAMSGSNPAMGFFATLIYGFSDAVSNNIATVNQRYDLLFKLSPYLFVIILYAIYSFIVKKRNKEEFEF